MRWREQELKESPFRPPTRPDEMEIPPGEQVNNEPEFAARRALKRCFETTFIFNFGWVKIRKKTAGTLAIQPIVAAGLEKDERQAENKCDDGCGLGHGGYGNIRYCAVYRVASVELSERAELKSATAQPESQCRTKGVLKQDSRGDAGVDHVIVGVEVVARGLAENHLVGGFIVA